MSWINDEYQKLDRSPRALQTLWVYGRVGHSGFGLCFVVASSRRRLAFDLNRNSPGRRRGSGSVVR